MSAFGDEMAIIALDLIGEFGMSVTYTKVTPGTRNLATGKSVPTEFTSTVMVLVEDYKGYDIAQGLVQQGDLKVTIPGNALITPPALGDKVLIRGVGHRVEGIKTYNAGDVAAMYVLQVRMG